MYADGCALLVSGALLPSVGETDKSHTDREKTDKKFKRRSRKNRLRRLCFCEKEAAGEVKTSAAA